MTKNKAKQPPIILIFIFFVLFARSAYASNIVDIVVDELGIPFVLDDEGQVWAFRKPLPYSLEEPIKLPNLKHIKKIAPYIAIDDFGRVFTWSFDEKKSIRDDQDELVEAAYTTPQRFGDFQGVTSIASTANHFVIVIANKEIIDWVQTQNLNSGIVSYEPIRKIISREGVKAISVTSWKGSIGATRVSDSALGLVALFNDGAVMGWGVSPLGQLVTPRFKQKITLEEWQRVKEAAWKNILITKMPDAQGVAIDRGHLVILSNKGIPSYWGGCGLYTVEAYEYTDGVSVSGVDGYIDSAVRVSLSNNYRLFPDLFIKRDGSVWAVYAPNVSELDSTNCLGSTKENQKAVRLGLSAPAKQIASGGLIRLVLDANHKLWKIGGGRVVKDTVHGGWINMPNEKSFNEISISLK